MEEESSINNMNVPNNGGQAIPRKIVQATLYCNKHALSFKSAAEYDEHMKTHLMKSKTIRQKTIKITR